MMANLAPQTQKTTGAWSRDEVRELNNALYIALEYFNIVEGGDKWAAKAIAKRARNWSVRWVSTFFTFLSYKELSVLLPFYYFGCSLQRREATSLVCRPEGIDKVPDNT